MNNQLDFWPDDLQKATEERIQNLEYKWTIKNSPNGYLNDIKETGWNDLDTLNHILSDLKHDYNIMLSDYGLEDTDVQELAKAILIVGMRIGQFNK